MTCSGLPFDKSIGNTLYFPGSVRMQIPDNVDEPEALLQVDEHGWELFDV
jgi:hypothetical protein